MNLISPENDCKVKICNEKYPHLIELDGFMSSHKLFQSDKLVYIVDETLIWFLRFRQVQDRNYLQCEKSTSLSRLNNSNSISISELSENLEKTWYNYHEFFNATIAVCGHCQHWSDFKFTAEGFDDYRKYGDLSCSKCCTFVKLYLGKDIGMVVLTYI